MDENIVKFQEKLRELVSLGKKKKGILEIQEINDFFSDMELDSDQMEKVFDYLEANNVDVLRISNDDDDIRDDIVMSDEDDIDVEKIDLSVPDGISIEDPVRMYLKEIGKVPLLSADEEVELAKRMAEGVNEAKEKTGWKRICVDCKYCKALCWTWYVIPGSDSGRKPGSD